MAHSIEFASTLNDLDNYLPMSRSECFDFGSWYGCRTDCPVFMRGECHLAKKEDFKSMAEMVNNCKDVSEYDIKDIKKHYPNLIPFLKER